MEKNKNKFGFTLIEIMIVLAILLTIAIPIIRFYFADELRELENEFFKALGVGDFARFIILIVLAFVVIYFKFRPDYLKAKKENRPFISKPVLCFSLVSFAIITILFMFAVI